MLVTKMSSRLIPFPVRTVFRNFPAFPTKGLPVLSSSPPGFCPTSINFALSGPSPGTACLAPCQRRHFLQVIIASLSSSRDVLKVNQLVVAS